METPSRQGNCCVLGRAMNLHRLPRFDPTRVEERPAAQLVLLALSIGGFLILFTG